MSPTKRAKRKPLEPNPEQLVAEMMQLVGSAGRVIAKAAQSRTEFRKVSQTTLQKALSSGTPFDALTKLRELIADDGVGAQEVVVFGYACILETNSAGLSVLFDRFDADELRKIDASFKSMGATRTLAALRAMRRLFDQARAKAARELDRESQVYVREMEQKLLGYCKAHLPELAAG